MNSNLSRGNRFKIWRSKQPYFVNAIITFMLTMWDIAWTLLFGITLIAIIIVAVLWLIGLASGFYAAH